MICLEEFEPNDNEDICLLKPCNHKFCYSCVNHLIQNFTQTNKKNIAKSKKNLSKPNNSKKICCPICRKPVKSVVKLEDNDDTIEVKKIIEKSKMDFNAKIDDNIKKMNSEIEFLKPYNQSRGPLDKFLHFVKKS